MVATAPEGRSVPASQNAFPLLADRESETIVAYGILNRELLWI
jgi:hypothetical protein